MYTDWPDTHMNDHVILRSFRNSVAFHLVPELSVDWIFAHIQPDPSSANQSSSSEFPYSMNEDMVVFFSFSFWFPFK